MKKLLIIDDEPGHRMMVRAVMEDIGWTVQEAGSGEEGHALAQKETPDVVLLDMRMPGWDGGETLKWLLADNPGLPVVMLTAYGTVGSAVESMKRGAYDFLTKPADNDELTAVLEKAHEYGRLMSENAGLKLRPRDDDKERTIIGDSPAMRKVLDLIEQVGPTEATVLILGESGTGKELVAEEIHKAGLRAVNPLIKVNCAALPANLLESELFGYTKGAFTGAVKDKPGRFQLASGGTLFLDEIGEMPPELQAKLLRVLQDGMVEPLGAIKAEKVDVRIIAATNRDLKRMVQEGGFREDLYFRLNVLEIKIPPLRERPGDLPLLMNKLLEKLGKKNRKDVRSVSPLFLEALQRYTWPGNVRELENVLERALILTRSDTITPEVLPEHITEAQSASPSERTDGADSGESSAVSLDEAEKSALIKALEAHNGHREKTAESLGISRRTLQYKLSKYGLTKR